MKNEHKDHVIKLSNLLYNTSIDYIGNSGIDDILKIYIDILISSHLSSIFTILEKLSNLDEECVKDNSENLKKIITEIQDSFRNLSFTGNFETKNY